MGHSTSNFEPFYDFTNKKGESRTMNSYKISKMKKENRTDDLYVWRQKIGPFHFIFLF